MKKLLFIFSTLILLKTNAQIIVGGVKIPPSLSAGDINLNLNGAGIREKYWIDLYVGGLYLKVKSSDASKIINTDEPMAIKLHIISSLITSEKMTEAVNEGFTKSTNGNLTPIQAKINQFKAVFKDEIKKGDIYDFIYEPTKGVVIFKNGKFSASIASLDFKKALFGIWLCNSPADENLKLKMLGK